MAGACPPQVVTLTMRDLYFRSLPKFSHVWSSDARSQPAKQSNQSMRSCQRRNLDVFDLVAHRSKQMTGSHREPCALFPLLPHPRHSPPGQYLNQETPVEGASTASGLPLDLVEGRSVDSRAKGMVFRGSLSRYFVMKS